MRDCLFRKGLTLTIIILFLGMSVFPSSAVNTVEKPIIPLSRGKTLYVGGTGVGNYTKIQDAINDAVDGDTVFVYDDSSPYYENVIVNKSINLIGEDRDTTIIDGNWSRNVVYISADNVNISGFTIQNSGHGGIDIRSNYYTIIGNNIILNNFYGIYGESCNYNTITGNTISSNLDGIHFRESCNYNTIIGNNITSNNEYGIGFRESCNYNTITGNTISNNVVYGIRLIGSSSNTIKGNNITSNPSNHYFGMILYDSSNNNIITGNIISSNNWTGIYLSQSKFNTITNNIISNNNETGIFLFRSCDNTITGNTISNNEDGIYLSDSTSNTIQKNNFIDNERDAFFKNIFPDIIWKRHTWKQNYWNKPRIFPKLIFGEFNFLGMYFTWLNIDWNPAKEPYDI